MKESKVEKIKELKLQVEELEERIAPAVLEVTQPIFVRELPTREIGDGALNASGHLPADGVVEIRES
jgi:hypothetical protein